MRPFFAGALAVGITWLGGVTPPERTMAQPSGQGCDSVTAASGISGGPLDWDFQFPDLLRISNLCPGPLHDRNDQRHHIRQRLVGPAHRPVIRYRPLDPRARR
jgi:hypothetical protein